MLWLHIIHLTVLIRCVKVQFRILGIDLNRNNKIQICEYDFHEIRVLELHKV